MKGRILIITTIITLAFISCGDKIPKDDIAEIKIINNSVHTVIIDISYEYPDTSMSKINDIGCSKILPNETCNAGTRHGWKEEIRTNEQGVIIFFIADIDTIIKYGSDASREQYLILKRYEFTENDLENMNWTITFP